MRRLDAVFALLLAAPACALGADAATPVQQAQTWLELLDAGRYAQAWERTASTLQHGTDLTRWSEAQISARGREKPACRKFLGQQQRETPARIDTLFVTEFADGRRIAEKVSVSTTASSITAYRIGPPPADPAARCSAADAERQP
ncbi:MAG TPA: DUF4019 domain-containing protein [Tahibacter sp.]|nr:DUF4019 domain-containing protein [Tahibacter sp.]